jgi:hypothetical protein
MTLDIFTAIPEDPTYFGTKRTGDRVCFENPAQ